MVSSLAPGPARFIIYTMAQYASHEFQQKLRGYGVRYSMSRKGSCGGNAPTECFFSGLKNERVDSTTYRTHREAAADLFEYIEVFYKNVS